MFLLSAMCYKVTLNTIVSLLTAKVMAMVERTKVILLFRFRSFSFRLVSRASPEFFSRKFKICTEYNQM